MLKILIIDDERPVCEFLSNFFTTRGMKAVTITDPAKALEKVKAEKPQLILLDILMPNVSGLDLLKQIREVDKNVKVIMVTVQDDEATRKTAQAYGASDFLSKPFTTNYLSNTVMSKITELYPLEQPEQQGHRQP